MPIEIGLKVVQQARTAIAGRVVRTPLVEFPVPAAGGLLYLKLENLQHTGAFKVRGVLNKIASLTAKERKRGVICATSGNHGLGVAHVARREGLRAVVIVPELTPAAKLSRLRELAEVEVFGATYQESYRHALQRSREEDLTYLPGFDDPLIIAGQGTIALEILEDLPETALVIAPIGGGGLVAGLLAALKSAAPRVRVIGVQAEGAPSARLSLQAGRIVCLESIDTYANGIAVKRPGELCFEIISTRVDDIVLVTDDQMRAAQKCLYRSAGIVAEGAGAAALAAALAGLAGPARPAVCLVSGGNASAGEVAALTAAD